MIARIPVPHGRLKSVISAGSGTVLGNALGALLPFCIAAWFVPGPSTDAYFYALGSVLYLGSVIALSVESSATPHVVNVRANGGSVETAVRHIFIQAVAASLILSGTGVLFMMLVLPHTTFDVSQQADILHMMLALTPLPPLITATSVLAGALYAHQQFLLPTMSLALRSVFAIALALLLRNELGMFAVIAGLVMGEALRVALLYWALRKCTRSRSSFSGPGRQPTARFWRSAGPQVVGMSLGGLSPMVDKTVAARAGAGAVTTLELAQRLAFTPMILLVSAVGLVVGAAWAQTLTQQQGREVVMHDFWRIQRLMLLVSIVAAAFCSAAVFLAQPLMARLLHVRDPLEMAGVFAILAGAMPILLFTNLCVRLLIANRQTGVMPYLAVVTVGLNVIFDVFFFGWFGLYGVAVASFLVAFLNAAMYLFVVQRTMFRAAAPPFHNIENVKQQAKVPPQDIPMEV